MKNSFKILLLLFGTLMMSQCKSSYKLNHINKLIIGTWAEKEDENVKFIITKKNIEYFDTDYLYDYKITDKNEFVVLDSSKVILKFEVISVSKDSLTLKSKNNGNRDIIYKYYRRE